MMLMKSDRNLQAHVAFCIGTRPLKKRCAHAIPRGNNLSHVAGTLPICYKMKRNKYQDVLHIMRLWPCNPCQTGYARVEQPK